MLTQNLCNHVFITCSSSEGDVVSRNMLGDSLSSLSVKDLKSLESKLEKGISRIRSKKVGFLPYFF